MKRIRVVSASFGNERKELVIKTPLAYKDYIIDVVCYNNGNTKSRINSLSPRLKSKIPKMMDWLDYPGYDFYIWADCKFAILDGFIENMLRYEGQADLFLFNHPERSSIKAELNFMNSLIINGDTYLIDRYGGELMDEQVILYLSDKGFVDNHLFSMGCFMFSKDLIKNRNYNIMTDWMLHSLLYSTQDQLSFPYLVHKHQVKYKVYIENILKNSYMVHTG